MKGLRETSHEGAPGWKPWAPAPSSSATRQASSPSLGLCTKLFFPEADYKPINKTCSHLTCFMALLAALLHNQFGEVGKSALLMLNTCTSTQKEARKRFIGGNIKPSLPWANAVSHSFSSQLLTRLTRLCESENGAHEVWLQYVLILMIHAF